MNHYVNISMYNICIYIYIDMYMCIYMYTPEEK